MIKKFSHLLIPLFLFIGSLLIYKYIYLSPRNWYDHYLYLTKSFIAGSVDLPDLPPFYHDKIEFEGKIYLPFPPAPTILMIPFVLLRERITQQQISVLIGSIDITLLYFLLLYFTSKKRSAILSIFFGFGTPFFWSTVAGTTWFFSHVVTIFFLTLSLILHF